MGWREWDGLRTTRARELDLGLVFEVVAARKRWLIGLPLAALVLVGVVLCLQPPRYSAETQVMIGPRHAGLIGLRAHLALRRGRRREPGAAHRVARPRPPGNQDLGIEDDPEFDPLTRGIGPGSAPSSSWHPARSRGTEPGGPSSRPIGPVASQSGGRGKSRHDRISDPSPDLPRTPPMASPNSLSKCRRRQACRRFAAHGSAIVSHAVAPNHPLYARRPC